MNYTLHQLRVFLEVVEHKSITKAAMEMHMTQPAVSIQLKNFQNQFDIPLTEIIGKKLCVTDFGMSIAKIARNILKEADLIKYKTKEYSGLMTGKLKISSASTGKYVLPYFLSAFVEQYTGIDFTLDVSNKTLVIESLKANKIDFALVSTLPEKVAIEEELLIPNQLFLINNNPTLSKEKPLIFREEGSATRAIMIKHLGKYKQRKIITLTSNEAVKQAVKAGLGYSILPLIGTKNELMLKQLYIIPTEGLPVMNHWRLVWLKNKKLSPVAEAFLTHLRSQKQQIMDTFFNEYATFLK